MKMNDSINFTKPDFGANPAVFGKEIAAELKKVSWPNRAEVIKLTAVVIGVSVMVGIYLGGLDFVFAKGIALLLSR